jgi:hypothetical protein
MLSLLVCASLGKAIVGSKVIVALNCGSKDQEVESIDKSFKYKADEGFVSGKSVDVDYHTNDEAKENDIKYPSPHAGSPSRSVSTCTSGTPTTR